MLKKAVNFTLSIGSILSLGTGVCYLWVFPLNRFSFWPHYLFLSFLIFVGLFLIAVLISLLDKTPTVYQIDALESAKIEKSGRRVWISWIALEIVMVALYFFFNGY